jgi:hypothetical protein
MKTENRWPTSVVHECRQCDELWELRDAFVDGNVVGDTRDLMGLTCAPGVRKDRFRSEDQGLIGFALNVHPVNAAGF